MSKRIVIIYSLLLLSLIGCRTEKNMNIAELIITGNENIHNENNEEIVALINFYKAFNKRDLTLMNNVWLNSDEASMNNPVGGIMKGWQEIEAVYDRIFNGKAEVYVEFYDFTIHKTEDMFFATGRERGYFRAGIIEIPLAIRTSRIFIKSNNQWKQIQHHGSIDDAKLLKTYQETVRK